MGPEEIIYGDKVINLVNTDPSLWWNFLRWSVSVWRNKLTLLRPSPKSSQTPPVSTVCPHYSLPAEVPPSGG
jgi:hypothetical protein